VGDQLVEKRKSKTLVFLKRGSPLWKRNQVMKATASTDKKALPRRKPSANLSPSLLLFTVAP
jgi:hypothetical protein